MLTSTRTRRLICMKRRVFFSHRHNEGVYWVKDILDCSSARWGSTVTVQSPISFITTLEDDSAAAESEQKQLGVKKTRLRAKRDLVREKRLGRRYKKASSRRK